MISPVNTFLNKLLTSVLIIGCSFTQGLAQEPIIEKEFLIITSTKDYSSALQTAERASKLLEVNVDLRGFYECSENGLKTDTICGCGENHGYVARGRYDDGVYLSIEFSNHFSGFREGYYMVILASGEKGNERLNTTLAKAKEHYSDAYIKSASIYMGCMH